MAFQIKEGRFIARLIYFEISSPAPRGNVMAWVYRDKDVEHNEWFLYYRMRYYKDDVLDHTSKDKRSEFLLQKDGRFDDIYPLMLEMMKMISVIAGNHNFDEVVVDSADPEFVMTKLGEQSWAHGTVETPSGQAIQA